MKFHYFIIILPICLFFFCFAGLADCSNIYVHPNGSCSGYTPCYSNISDALTHAANGDTIIILANINDNIIAPTTPMNIAIKGNTPSITLTGGGGVNISSGTVTVWTIKDLVLTNVVTAPHI